MQRMTKGEHPSASLRLQALIDRARELGPIAMAVVHPVDEPSLSGAADAAKAGLIKPLFVGPEDKIRRAAKDAQIDLAGIEIISTPHSHAAAERAVELVREGRAQSIMKGALHTDEVLAPVVDKTKGLRTARRMSHVFVLDAPQAERLLFVSDAAINIAPTLDELKDIVQNAIDMARATGVETPRVAILSAVETVTAKLPSTLNAAALCKMADRGQITGGVLDGPLAFDNAISKEAAETKHIVSPVAGAAEVLIVPDLISGNVLVKELDYLAGAEAAGLVVGARAPIALTSRADTPFERVASAALAVLFHHWSGLAERGA